LWAYDKTLTEDQKLKGMRNYKTLLLLLSGITEGTYKIDFINENMYLKSDSCYGYTKKYSYGRLYPVKASISQISREFRYYLFDGLYNDVDIINYHPAILYEYANKHQISTTSLGELVNHRELFYSKIENDYSFGKIDTKKIVLIAFNTNKNDFKSNLLNNLTRDLNLIRNKLYEEFYLNNSTFRSAIDFRCENNNIENDLKMKTQSLFCFNRETECIMSFKDFYISNIPSELHERSSFIPFFNSLYIHTDPISYLNVSNMTSTVVKVDLEDIIAKYNTNNNIKFKHKSIVLEDTLIPRDIFNDIIFAIGTLEHMNYKEIAKQFESLDLSSELVVTLHDILNDSECPEVTFEYNQLTQLQGKVRIMFNKLIYSLIARNK
jgi:galactitol-specific phosphotransferase system IIB component